MRSLRREAGNYPKHAASKYIILIGTLTLANENYVLCWMRPYKWLFFEG